MERRKRGKDSWNKVDLLERRSLMTARNLIGRKFGRLSPIKYVGKNKHNKPLWLCKCDCGNEKTIVENNIKNGHTKSCGCLQKEIAIQNNLKHGHTSSGERSRTYVTWDAMIQRCTNLNHPQYQDYGGRNPPITVCNRWNIKEGGSFENFLKDMGEKPTNRHQIDRIDNNKGYYKLNCRWALSKENNRNRRNTNKLMFNKKSQYLMDLADEFQIDRATLWSRVYIQGLSIKKALTTPVKSRKKRKLKEKI